MTYFIKKVTNSLHGKPFVLVCVDPLKWLMRRKCFLLSTKIQTPCWNRSFEYWSLSALFLICVSTRGLSLSRGCLTTSLPCCEQEQGRDSASVSGMFGSWLRSRSTSSGSTMFFCFQIHVHGVNSGGEPTERTTGCCCCWSVVPKHWTFLFFVL